MRHLPLFLLIVLFSLLAVFSPAFPRQPGAEVSTRSRASPSRPLTAAGTSPVGACAGDLSGDRDVDQFDVAVLLANFGRVDASHPQGDLNDDQTIDGRDLVVLLSCFGDEGDDLVQLGHCPSYATVPACIAELEGQFRASVADVPTAVGAPYPRGYIVGDFNRNGVIDGQDLSVLLGEFGCNPTPERSE